MSLNKSLFVLQADVISRPIILRPFPPDFIRHVHRSLCWILSNNSVLCARVSRTRFSFPLPSSLPSKYRYLDISYLVISEFSISCAPPSPRCPVLATSVGAFFLCPLRRMSSGLGRFTRGAPSLFSSLRFFCLPAVLPFHKYAYSGIKWPIFLKKSPFLLHIPFFCCTFAPDFRTWNDGQTTVKRRSSDGQSQRNLPVTPQTSPNLCIILYYIFIYNIH